jgi:hypothetical protein
MYCDWNAAPARKAYVVKFVAAWLTAIAVAAFPVIMAVNAVTL